MGQATRGLWGMPGHLPELYVVSLQESWTKKEQAHAEYQSAAHGETAGLGCAACA